MSSIRRSTTAALATGACLVAASVAMPGPTAAGAPTASEATAAAQQMEASLRGRTDGDPNGTGHATFRLFPRGGKVCARVTWARIGTPNAAHIHRRSDGGVVVDLTGSVTGGARCNPDVTQALVRRILEHPRFYYFNVHNTRYPAGAIRGPLHR